MQKEKHTHQPSLWRQLRQSRSAVFALTFLSVLIFLSLFANIISNDLPLTCRYKNERVFPALTPQKIDSSFNQTYQRWDLRAFRDINWRKEEVESVVWPLIPYGSQIQPRSHRLLSPFGKQEVIAENGEKIILKGFKRHLLGTTQNGQDVLAALLRGGRVSLSVGILVVLLSGIIGIFIGAAIGFWGDYGIQLKRGMIWMMIPALFLGWFYGFRVRRFILLDAFEESFSIGIPSLMISLMIVLAIFFVCYFAGKIISRYRYFNHTISFPLDSIVMRIIEILKSMPTLLLIISVAAVLGRSLWVVMLILGLLSWTGVARLVRGEMLRVSRMGYIEAARAQGIPPMIILLRHALPNAMPPVWVALAFGVGGAIIAESSLSFLHLIEYEVTWGNLLSAARSNLDAWWIGVFPGLAIFFTVLSFNILGERLRDLLDPRFNS